MELLVIVGFFLICIIIGILLHEAGFPWLSNRPLDNRRLEDKRRITALRRRASRARLFPTNTCPASRHLHIMADALLKAKKDGSLRYPMLAEEPEHCAESILAVLASLWEARTKLEKYEPTTQAKIDKAAAKLLNRIAR